MRNPVVVIALFVFAAIAPRIAAACRCVEPPPPLAALEQADAVFTGEVTRISRGRSSGEISVRFRLSRSFKGTTQRSVTVHTSRSSASCGFGFQDGEYYIVYAYETDGALGTGLCTRTRPLSSASYDLGALGDGEEIGRPRGGCGGPNLLGALQAVLFVLVALVLMRRP